MNVGNSGARFRITAIIAVISLTLGGMFGISSASGDEGVEEMPIAVATAEESSFEPSRVPAEAPDPVIVDELYNDWFECSGVWLNTGAIVQYYTWDEATQEFVLGDPVEVWGEPSKVRDLTEAEKLEMECSSPEPSEEPSEDPSEQPSEEPSEEPVDLPVTGDLLVECTNDGRLSMTNGHTWHALVIAGYFDENGTEVPLTYDVDVYAGTTEYVDITTVPSGTEVFYLINWMDLEGDSESFSTHGTIACGEPTSSPTPTPSASASPAPSVDPTPTQPSTPPTTEPTPIAEPTASVDPTPTQTVKPTPTESAKPSPTKSADQKPTKAPVKPSGKSDPQSSSKSGVVDEPVNGAAALLAFGVVGLGAAAVGAASWRRRLS